MDKARKKTNILTSWVYTDISHPNVTFYLFSFIFWFFSLTLKICFLLTLVFILALSYNINKNKFKITVPILILSKITDWSLIFFTVVFVLRIYTSKCMQTSKAIRNPFLCVWLFPIWHGVHSCSLGELPSVAALQCFIKGTHHGWLNPPMNVPLCFFQLFVITNSLPLIQISPHVYDTIISILIWNWGSGKWSTFPRFV